MEKQEIKEEKVESSEAATTPGDIPTLGDDSGVKEKPKDPLLDDFYSEIEDIKTEEFKSSSREQLERLLRPGSTYFNLNPFDVLQIDPFASLDEIKRKYRKLSMYVHPDKNPNEKERAQIAFEAVNKAYKLLEDESERKKCLEVVEEAKERVDKMCEEKRKKAKKDLKAIGKKDKIESEGKIDEDDPDKYRHAIYVMTCKLFADIERLKVRENEKVAEEKKRKAAEKSESESKNKIQKEWDKNYDESREKRVNSWQSFVNKKGSGPSSSSSSSSATTGAKLIGSTFRPPKHKPEKR